MPVCNKAIAAALLPAIASGCTTPQLTVQPPATPLRLAIAPGPSDFVIRTRDDAHPSIGPTSAAQMMLGSSVHLDRSLVGNSPAASLQEKTNVPMD